MKGYSRVKAFKSLGLIRVAVGIRKFIWELCWYYYYGLGVKMELKGSWKGISGY